MGLAWHMPAEPVLALTPKTGWQQIMLMLNRTCQFSSYCANQRDSGAPLRSSGTGVEIDPSLRAEVTRQVLGLHGLAARDILAHASSARETNYMGTPRS
jgi:hypothetical protein